jgi:hypothetical protein
MALLALAAAVATATAFAAAAPAPSPPAAPSSPAAAPPASAAPPALAAPPENAAGGAAAAARAAGQTDSDDYTRYELLQPESASFHILYEVTATRAEATSYFNPIRKGSEASGEAVYDRATGKALRFDVVSGDEARADSQEDLDREMRYLRIHLAHPVPRDGGVRLLIDKTYKDAKSYYRKGADRIVFARPLGVRRDAIVLPAGYELVACNIPSQVLPEPDGRTKVSFMHTGPEPAPLILEARRLADGPDRAGAAAYHAPADPQGAPAGTGAAAAAGPTPAAERLSERAHQDRTIVYLLRQPETHSFDLYHDYTEVRPGTDKYLNVVRKGSASSAPAARILDTGVVLRVETVRGAALRQAGLSAAELREIAGENGEIGADTEVVIAHFPPLAKGESVRLRISETYTDPRSYRLDGDLLMFDRSFGRPRDAVVLPAGWYLTASAIPAIVTEQADGRIRLDFLNPRPDEIAVLIEARRRPAPPGGGAPVVSAVPAAPPTAPAAGGQR